MGSRIKTGTDCNCFAYQSEEDCNNSGYGCQWRPLFDSCHPPELLDDATPICPESEAPTLPLDGSDKDSIEPTSSPTKLPTAEEESWFDKLFYTRESQSSNNNLISTDTGSTLAPDELDSSTTTETNTTTNTDGSNKRRRMTTTDNTAYNDLSIIQKMESQYRASLLQNNNNNKKQREIEIQALPINSKKEEEIQLVPSSPIKEKSLLEKMEELYIKSLSSSNSNSNSNN